MACTIHELRISFTSFIYKKMVCSHNNSVYYYMQISAFSRSISRRLRATILSFPGYLVSFFANFLPFIIPTWFSEKIFPCENDIATVTCDAPGTTIDITYANYGRRSTEVCQHATLPSSDTGCQLQLENALNIVRGRCQGKQSCQLSASNAVFGDTCPGTWKYLEVHYICKQSEYKAKEPRSEKTGLRIFRPGPIQTGLYSYGSWLEA